MKFFSRTFIGILTMMFIFGTSPAYAIFGIRKAKKAATARQAQKTASKKAKKDKTVPQTAQEKLAQQEKEDITFDDIP